MTRSCALLFAVCALCATACADESITPDRLDEDGRLVADAPALAGESGALPALSPLRIQTSAAAQVAERLALDAGLVLVTDEPVEAAEDRGFSVTRGRLRASKTALSAVSVPRPGVGSDDLFDLREGSLELRVRVPEQAGRREVIVAWTHDDVRIERHRWLEPGAAAVVADSHPIDPGRDAGAWTVEILGAEPGEPVLFERSFEIRPVSG